MLPVCYNLLNLEWAIGAIILIHIGLKTLFKLVPSDITRSGIPTFHITHYPLERVIGQIHYSCTSRPQSSVGIPVKSKYSSKRVSTAERFHSNFRLFRTPIGWL